MWPSVILEVILETKKSDLCYTKYFFPISFSEQKLVLGKFYKPSFFGKAHEPSRTKIRAKNEPSLGSGATLIIWYAFKSNAAMEFDNLFM